MISIFSAVGGSMGGVPKTAHRYSDRIVPYQYKRHSHTCKICNIIPALTNTM
jgi:hypothetical protein